MLIVIQEDHRGRWRTNLTDQVRVYRRRQHVTASHALAEVTRLMSQGHAPAFRSAYRALLRSVPLAPLPEMVALVAAD